MNIPTFIRYTSGGNALNIFKKITCLVLHGVEFYSRSC